MTSPKPMSISLEIYRIQKLVHALPLLVALGLGSGCREGIHPVGEDHEEHAGHDHSAHGHAHPAPPEAGGISTPSAAASDLEDQCAAHQVPRRLCFICDAGLRDAARLWCGEHGRYEDRCWKCHPELREPGRLYCEEHGLYEDECYLCRPQLAPAPGARAASGSRAAGLMCAEHGVAEAECGICRPEATALLNPGAGLKVRLPQKDSARSAGVETGKPSVGSIAEGIDCYAGLALNQNKLARIVAPVGGIIHEVCVDLGGEVEEKQAVARLWSAGIAEAVAKAVLSHQTLDRERRLREERVTSEQTLQEAEAAHRAACQQLRTLGFTEEQIDALGHEPHDRVLMDVSAPFAGEIVERTAVLGTLVEEGRPLFTITDRSVMWAMLNVPESALARVRIGQTVELRLDSIPGKVFTGRLTWVGAEVDGRSRMAQARAEVSNPDGVLKAQMFARARILTRNAEGALLVPAAAIQQVEGKSVVFVKLDEDLYEARRIRLGARSQGLAEVLQGLGAEEEVAIAQVFPLKSQLLVSRLGAGCAHEK